MRSVQTQGNKAPFLPFLSKLQHKQIHQGNSDYCYLTQGAVPFLHKILSGGCSVNSQIDLQRAETDGPSSFSVPETQAVAGGPR